MKLKLPYIPVIQPDNRPFRKLQGRLPINSTLASKIIMAPIDEIKSFLSNYPDLYVEETTDSIVVLPKDFSGFKVRFNQWKSGYILSYGNWHEYLPKSELGAKVAIGLFKFGLSDSCKLTICRKGNIDYHCSLSYNDPTISQWTIIAKQKISIYPFWEPEEVRVLQNDLLTGDQLSELFESNEFEKVITELKYERKHAKYALTYISIWAAIFLKLNNFDIGNIKVSFVLFAPVIILTFFLPILIIRNWFDDRKWYKFCPGSCSLSPTLFLWDGLWGNSSAAFVFAVSCAFCVCLLSFLCSYFRCLGKYLILHMVRKYQHKMRFSYLFQ